MKGARSLWKNGRNVTTIAPSEKPGSPRAINCPEEIVTKRTSFRLGAWTAFLLLATSASSALAEGDPAAGEELAYTCMGCHGIDGYRNAYPSYRVPKLGGQRASYIETALKAYRSGSRPHPTMQAQGSSLSDQDIEDIAAWFENGEAVAVSVSGDEPDYPDVGQTCLACHGQGGEAVQPTPPVLSGQYESYIVHALEQYRSGARGGNVMNAFAGNLSDEDIARLATFYSTRSGLYTPEKTQ